MSACTVKKLGASAICVRRALSLLTTRSGALRTNHCVNASYSAPFPPRTHTCGSLTSEDAGTRVVLTGWIQPGRHVKNVLFVPLRDSYGTTQLLISQEDSSDDVFEGLRNISPESIVLIEGRVRLRPEKSRRPDPTGQVEVLVDRYILLNAASQNLPFLPSDTKHLANDDLRAKYRYLDLRRPALSNNLKKRSRVAHIVRSVLLEEDFTEVETPILLKSTPEGAREFLVPTRILTSGDDGHGPQFYALTQSPQQPKQLLICSGGVDKYFQIAKCFRDEDGRKDRQPEFTQIDLEMAFVSWGRGDQDPADSWRIGGHEVREVVEKMIKSIWQEVEGVTLPDSFAVMTYLEAMSRFGSDKPDLRFGLEIADVTHLLPESPRASLESSGDVVECIVARGPDKSPFLNAARKLDFENRQNAIIERVLIKDDNHSSWLSKSKIISTLQEGILDQDPRVNDELRTSVGDVVWLSRRRRVPEGGSTTLGRIRLAIADLAKERGEYTPTSDPHFLWVTEFPLFTRADEDKQFLAHGRWSSSHHPFTAPMWQDIGAMYEGRIEFVRGQHYDLVLNGVEIGGGSVRVHDPAMQEYIFSNILQLDASEQASFDHLLHALKCGAPPHGGMALGFDRLMSILCKTQSIRDVIAFPKTGSGTDMLFKSPAPVPKEILYQYGIQPR
ncbi:aspartyl-tRNA synthetase [Gloeophyllum trabeum ATCC 11539]|uniref:Aspartyl-tRNA synthetase n=1 Tax=Gloeophyllum trabeum (strain ATCC 11539 / FP-39264 / Madison 617) TaxID=670483 RepID=S7QJZ9_GLOTA|nr:aspartyl-tRNA synthetase [Gloeophyllum trabeum ATCC 11539]EPQ59543.1 aspartyl-tRNA synthetase [Gloeophyllum trabeum ATCC 11539]